MILCDIGNSYYHFNADDRIFNEKELSIKGKKIYYISVNEEKEKILLKKNKGSISLNDKVKFQTSYAGLGIDRIMACKTISDGLVVDAGTAITIDIMSGGIHLGGVIMPGIEAFRKSFAEISPKLDLDFNMNLDFEVLPVSTNEALSYGSIGAVIKIIKDLAKNNKIYFTGGDGEYFSRYFENSIYVKNLVFEGMKQTIKECKI